MPPPLELARSYRSADPPGADGWLHNYAFGQVVRRHGGVGLPATEMFSARGFWRLTSAMIGRRNVFGVCSMNPAASDSDMGQ